MHVNAMSPAANSRRRQPVLRSFNEVEGYGVLLFFYYLFTNERGAFFTVRLFR
jgi:hypothetical protein